MRLPAADESGWRARLVAAGVRVDSVNGDIDDRELALLELTVLRAGCESTLSDDDLYPVLPRVLTGPARVRRLRTWERVGVVDIVGEVAVAGYHQALQCRVVGVVRPRM